MSPTRVRVSVVIPCFNYGCYLSETVESVLSQTLRELEVIIVDDGSEDNSREVAQRLVAAHPGASIRLICQPNSGSPGAARNTGVEQASGEYILCLDADDILAPDYLRACVSALDGHPEAAIAYGDLQMFGDSHQLVDTRSWNARAELEANFIGSASVFRRTAFEAVGGYAPELGYEDWDFWIGCIDHGWEAVKAPGALWYYRVHSGGVYSCDVKNDQALKARIVLKHPSLYNEGQRRWAGGVLAGDATALAAGTPTGVIPSYYGAPHRTQIDDEPLPIRSICLITKDYPPRVPGGIPRAVQMQAHLLSAAGVDVHVITRSLTGAETTWEDAGVIVHEVPEPGLAAPPGLEYLEIPLWSWTTAAKFAQLDESVRFDIVEAPDYRGEALHLAPRPGTAMIVWLHSTMMVHWEFEPGYRRTPANDAWHALEMSALERADLLLAPSHAAVDTTARYLGDRMRPVEVIRHLFDCSEFPVRHRQRGGGPIRALFFGRLESVKNPELALRSVAAARARGLDVELTLVGRDNGKYRERVLLPLENDLGLDDVSYVPHVDTDTLRAELARTDVVILPSRFDSGPLTVYESLSSGVPVITSDRVGAASWVKPRNGLLVLPIDDTAEFCRRAADAMADPDWMASGARGAVHLREEFSPVRATERLLHCYRRLVASRTPPGQQIKGTRTNAVLAFADELLDDPSLLRVWAHTFDARDDITLVIYAPGWTVEEAELRLTPLVHQTGLDGDDAADLLARASTPSSAVEARLADGAKAILTRRRRPAPWATVPMVDDASTAALRGALALGERPGLTAAAA